jgi:hypothetical protein
VASSSTNSYQLNTSQSNMLGLSDANITPLFSPALSHQHPVVPQVQQAEGLFDTNTYLDQVPMTGSTSSFPQFSPFYNIEHSFDGEISSTSTAFGVASPTNPDAVEAPVLHS